MVLWFRHCPSTQEIQVHFPSFATDFLCDHRKVMCWALSWFPFCRMGIIVLSFSNASSGHDLSLIMCLYNTYFSGTPSLGPWAYCNTNNNNDMVLWSEMVSPWQLRSWHGLTAWLVVIVLSASAPFQSRGLAGQLLPACPLKMLLSVLSDFQLPLPGGSKSLSCQWY